MVSRHLATALIATLAATAAASVPAPAMAQTPPAGTQLLYLAEDVPAGLDYDGPSVAVNTSQVGFINLMEPLIYYPYAAQPNDEGIRQLDFHHFEGRLIERWDHDAATKTWTMHLRQGVKSAVPATSSAPTT